MNNFNEQQLEQIKLGESDNLDVNIYSKSYFDYEQMRQIRYGLMHNIDVSIYAYPYFNNKQMYQIRNGLEFGLPAIVYAIPYLKEDEMEVIFNVLNIYLYNNPSLNVELDLKSFKQFYIEFLKKRNIQLTNLYQNIEIIKKDIKKKVKYAKR